MGATRIENFAVARNPTTAPAVLRQLALDTDWEVRREVAAHAQEPALLEQLAVDPHVWVRVAVAGNLSVTVATLTWLADDPAWGVREQVAGNRHCPPDVLAKLAFDKEPEVREQVRQHPACPVATVTVVVPMEQAEAVTSGKGVIRWLIEEGVTEHLQAALEEEL